MRVIKLFLLPFIAVLAATLVLTTLAAPYGDPQAGSLGPVLNKRLFGDFSGVFGKVGSWFGGGRSSRIVDVSQTPDLSGPQLWNRLKNHGLADYEKWTPKQISNFDYWGKQTVGSQTRPILPGVRFASENHFQDLRGAIVYDRAPWYKKLFRPYMDLSRYKKEMDQPALIDFMDAKRRANLLEEYRFQLQRGRKWQF